MISCDFCGRNEIQINTKIIAADGVAICYTCVLKCVETIAKSKHIDIKDYKENS